MKIRACITTGLCVLLLGSGLSAEAAPAISSASAVVYEPESGMVLYEKDGDTPRPMASTTKLMTGLLAAERLSADQKVTVPAAALPVEGSQIGLKAGDTLTVEDLLTGLLLSSGNDTANVLALQMAEDLPGFARLMNERAAELGMKHSTFVTPSGLDAGEHSASARDMAVLGAAVLEQPLLARLCASKNSTLAINGHKITVRNHNKLLQKYDGCIGLKTGFTKKSGRCLVSAAQRDGVTLVVATLNGGDYWNDHMALYAHGFAQVERCAVPQVKSMTCSVAGGTEQQVMVMAHLPEAVTVRRGEKVTCKMELPRFLWAPVEAGEQVGRVICQAGDRRIGEYPLTVAASVSMRPIPTGKERWKRHMVQLWNGLTNE